MLGVVQAEVWIGGGGPWWIKNMGRIYLKYLQAQPLERKNKYNHNN